MMCCGGGTVDSKRGNATATTTSADKPTTDRQPEPAAPARNRFRRRNKQDDYDATSLHDAVMDVDERLEIARILPYLEDDERVMVVAKQSRVFPGATLVFTPDTVFCTTRRIIIRSPMMLGLRYHVEYYRHRDIKTARLVRGRFTSSLMFTVPGMGTAARSASGANDGIISAIPHDKAEAIYRIMQRGGERGGESAGTSGSGNTSDSCDCAHRKSKGSAKSGAKSGGRRSEPEHGRVMAPEAAAATPAGTGQGSGGATGQ